MTPRGAAVALIVALLYVVSCEAQGAGRAGARARGGATGAPRGARGGGARASGRARSGTAAASAASRSYRGRAAPRSTAGIARRRAGIYPNAAGNSGAGRHDARAAPRPGLATRTAPRTFATDGRARPAVDAALSRVPTTTTTTTATAATRPRTTHERPHASTVNALYDTNLPKTAASAVADGTWSVVARPTPEVQASDPTDEPSDDAVVAVVDVGARPEPLEPFADEQAAASTDSEAGSAETGGDEKTAIGPRPSVNARPVAVATATNTIPQPETATIAIPQPEAATNTIPQPPPDPDPELDTRPRPARVESPSDDPQTASSETRRPAPSTTTTPSPSTTSSPSPTPSRGTDPDVERGQTRSNGGFETPRFYAAPRGFGRGVAREPDCAAVMEAKRPGQARRTTDRRAHLVRFKPGVSAERFREVSLAVGERRPGLARGNGTETDSGERMQVVDVSPSSVLVPSAPGFRTATLWTTSSGDDELDEFRARFDADIELIEPDFTMTAFQNVVAAPRREGCGYSQANLMPGQWNLDRVDGPRLDGYFSPPECLCGKGIHVYVLDTGVRLSHEDFAPRGVRTKSGWNFVGDACGGGVVDDRSGHGTHVAATAVGATSGVAKCAVLVPVRILDENGRGDGGAMLSALDWVADHDPGAPGARKIVSMSVGGPRSAVIDAAVRELVSAGIVVVAAAGNSGEDASGTSPAGEVAAITVGSTGCEDGDSFGPSSASSTMSCGGPDAMSDFSNRGAAVDVYAPGAGVRSAWMTGDRDFRRSSGTSMATPLVTGCVALYLEKYPAATPEDVARAIKSSATRMRGGAGAGDAGVLNPAGMLSTPPAAILGR